MIVRDKAECSLPYKNGNGFSANGGRRPNVNLDRCEALSKCSKKCYDGDGSLARRVNLLMTEDRNRTPPLAG
jgi:hypothetical protein